MPLNDTQCRTAKPKDKPYKLSDSAGLYLHVMPSGAKYWRLKYRLHGKEQLISIGVYPSVTLLGARKERDRIKNTLKNGADPRLEKMENRQIARFQANQTFRQIAEEWHANNKPDWDARYAKTVLHRLSKYTFGEIGDFPITDLKPVLILACLQKIEKTAPEMARRVKQLISHIFRYAVATNRADSDITVGLESALRKYKKGHFNAIEVDELPQFLIDLRHHKARLYKQTFLAIQFMLLTFVRTGELVGAKWTEIDFEKALWKIPAERMKMRTCHLVPLSKQALEILKDLREMNGKREFVFPSIPHPRKPMSKGTILVALKRMGYGHRMTGHGFRSLALGILKEKLGYLHEVADRQLAHVPKSSTDKAYDRAKFLPQRTEMMQKYADYIDREYIAAINEKTRMNSESDNLSFAFQTGNYRVSLNQKLSGFSCT